MKLHENINKIKTMMGITESKIEDGIQFMIDGVVENLQDESFEFGLGEMDELDEINSIDKVKVTNFIKDEVPVLYVDFYVNSNRRDFDIVIGSIKYEVGKYIPKIQIILDNIIDTRTFGPGIDW